MNTSTFFITLSNDELPRFHKNHTIFGRVAEGLEILDKFNSLYIDEKTGRPLQNVRIKHALVINEDKFTDDSLPGLAEIIPSRSPSPIRGGAKGSLVKMNNGNLEFDSEGAANVEDDIDLEEMANKMTKSQLKEQTEKYQTKARAQVLEILNDLPEAEVEPPKNVLFVCQLNPVTQEHDLEIIFSRFGKITSCDVVRDWKTGDSLQYAFIEYEEESACA